MLIKFARSVTPRAAGVFVLLAAAIAAALVATVGTQSTSPASHQRLAAAGTNAASTSSSSSSNAAVGNGPIVSTSVRHATSAPLRTLKPTAFPPTGPKLTPDADGKYIRPSSGNQADPVVQKQFGSGQIPATSLNFEGVAVGQGGSWAPPDPNGAVGLNNYVEIVNDGFAVFSKTGTKVYGPVPTNTLFQALGGNCAASNDGDGTVLYDHFTNRWVLQQFQVSRLPYGECVAVSTTSDPTGSWHLYQFNYNNQDFVDYPKLGVWSDGYYITYNVFANGQSYSGPEVCALDRTSMIAGLTATQQCFKKSTSYFSLLPADVDGPTLPPAGSSELLLSYGVNSLQLWKFHVDWTTPANSNLTGPTQISVPAFNEACGGGTCIPQPSTGQMLDSLGDRLMYRLAYRNFGDHESLVVTHSVAANGVTGMRWYELRGPWNTPTVFQSGTYAPDTTYRWMGSIAQDHVGDMALGFAVSSTSVRPAARYTGRLVGDALGTMGQGEGTLVTGSGSQTTGLSRWGDYTSMSVDPVDDCTFWYLGEYLTTNGTWNWQTRIGAFEFPSCTGGGGVPPVVASFNPTSGPVGTNVAITGTGFTGATSVAFNSTNATTFTVDSDTSIHATVPGGATTGLISVTTPNGTGQSATNFTVTGGGGGNPPTVTSFFPTSGPVGTNVSITGTNFTGATSVKFNGVAATNFTVNSDTSVNANVPGGATTGPIAVTTPNGTGTSSTNFTVTTVPSRPTITGFTPPSGRRGSSVTINGTNFTGATSVKLGPYSATYTVNSSTKITAVVPFAAHVGYQYKWSVTTPGGSATSFSYFRVTG
jgi:IPT/TIG domain-containing protein